MFQHLEDLLLESLAGMVKELYPDITLVRLDEDYPKVEGAYVALQVMSYTETGEDDEYYLDTGFKVITMGYEVNVDFQAFRVTSSGERPMQVLKRLKHHLYDDEFRYKHLTKNKIGYLRSSSVARRDVFLDSQEKELRARMNAVFHVTISDQPVVEEGYIETVNYTYDQLSPDQTNKITLTDSVTNT